MKKALTLSLLLLLFLLSGVAAAEEIEGVINEIGLAAINLKLDDLNAYLEEAGFEAIPESLPGLQFANRFTFEDIYFGTSSYITFKSEEKDEKVSTFSYALVGFDGGKVFQLNPETELKLGAGVGLGVISLYLNYNEPADFAELIDSANDSTMTKYYFMLAPEIGLNYKVNENGTLSLAAKYHYGLSSKKWYHLYQNSVEGPLSTLQGTSVSLSYGFAF